MKSPNGITNNMKRKILLIEFSDLNQASFVGISTLQRPIQIFKSTKGSNFLVHDTRALLQIEHDN